MSVADFSKTIAGGSWSPASSGWPQSAGSNMYAPYQANVVWQDTSSNATYCSVASALGGQP